MVDNIKIIGNITNTTQVSRYSQKDLQLIPTKEIKNLFGGIGDYIEYFVYDVSGNLLNINYNYLDYKLPSNSYLNPVFNQTPNTTGNIQTEDIGIISTLSPNTSSLYPIIEIDPILDLRSLGYFSGEFNVRYNLFQNIISNVDELGLYIKEISQDRTEVRLASTIIKDNDIENIVNKLIEERNNSQYYIDYLLNFGNNNQVLAVNIALNKTPEGNEILFKLYQPLPINIQEKDILWVVQEKVEPYVFDINLDKIISEYSVSKLRGPNFNIEISNQGTISTEYNSYYNTINNLQLLQSSSYNQLLNLIEEKGIDINVDYTDFNNFVFFGSAYKRLSNFYYKIQQIEDYQNLINLYTPYISTTSSLQIEINSYSSSINDIISKFDGYEYYLYFESSSYAWPKSNNNKPYVLLSTSSAIVSNWYNNLTSSAKNYDNDNYDNLEYIVPTFIKDDGSNAPFLTFLNMVGHYFDNIWIYLKAITDINRANNNLELGISKDIVYNQLQSLGIKLYNSQAGYNINNFLIGDNTGSAYYSGSLNDFSPTSSYLNNIPRKDLLSELYKRIYHNLPLLLKTKGTVAGLEYLISIFGIPSRTYVSGSIISGSILNVKEFGGSTKSQLISNYNNDKVRIISNNITGSVLSPILSLQTFPSASSQFRNIDQHYVDISFSPETQMDTYTSGAISNNNPTWSLDDYIGDPRQIYSSSYEDLDKQRTLYYNTGVSGYPGFTGSLLDYNGFIRLIQFFDNSLFKMLNDFTPERISLSTGVTINSPFLERNKVVYSIPNINKQEIHEANYEVASIGAQYGQLYEALQDDKKAFFNGELSGSQINIYQYFKDDFNPYDGDWNIWNTQHTVSESINMNTFLHSDWNVLLNNVSQSVISNIRKHIEYIYGTTGSILKNAELQDSYLSLKSYNNSRYDGSKTTSLKYNTYTSSSYIGADNRTIQIGDNSYGKTSAIDRNTYKIAWVKNIPSQSLNFYNKTSINLKYLVDSQNNLTELSKGNFNLHEVQRTFKSGDPVVLSISDIKNPSNQVSLDGEKEIWKGGYSYDPILFREANETLYFIHDNYISSSIGNLGVKAFCDDKYDYRSEERGKFVGNNGPTLQAPPHLPADNILNAGVHGSYRYRINGVDGSTTEGKSMVYTYVTHSQWRYANSNGNYLNNNIPGGTGNVRLGDHYVYSFNLLNFNNLQGGYNTESDPNTYSPINNDGNYYYKVPRTGNYVIKAKIPFSYWGDDTGPSNRVLFKVACVVEKTSNPYDENSWTYVSNTILNPLSQPPSVNGGWTSCNSAYNAIWYDGTMSDFATYTMDIDTSLSPVALNSNEYIRIQFYFLDRSNLFGNGGSGTRQFEFYINGAPPNKSVPRGYFEIYDNNTPITIYHYTSSYGQIPALFTTSSSNTLVFHQSASYLFTTASTFVPSLPYSQYYSPVVDYFGIQKYDLLRLGSFESPISEYYEVLNVSSSLNNTYITLNKNIVSSSYNDAQSFAIFRPKPDETSVIINYKKQLGEVSQTILVPYDANENIKNNIGNIFKTLNTDLQ